MRNRNLKIPTQRASLVLRGFAVFGSSVGVKTESEDRITTAERRGTLRVPPRSADAITARVGRNKRSAVTAILFLIYRYGLLRCRMFEEAKSNVSPGITTAERRGTLGSVVAHWGLLT